MHMAIRHSLRTVVKRRSGDFARGGGVGAGRWESVIEAQRSVASLFSNGTPLDVELMAADVNGDMAYTIGYERCSGSVHGGPARPVFLATQIYRRENGE